MSGGILDGIASWDWATAPSSFFAALGGGAIVALFEAWQQRPRRIVLGHVGVRLDHPDQRLLFIKVVNTSRSRPTQITHVFFDGVMGKHRIQVFGHIKNAEKLGMLEPGMEQEIWCPAGHLPGLGKDDSLVGTARVRFADGRISRARLNGNVPPIGNVSSQSFEFVPEHLDPSGRFWTPPAMSRRDRFLWWLWSRRRT